MDSDFQQQQYQHHFQDLQRQFNHQKQQVNTLTRFQSAPSSYFASFLDAAECITNTAVTGGGSGGDRSDFSSVRPLSPETENIFARFMSSMEAENNTSSSQKLSSVPGNLQMEPDFMVRVKQESDTLQQQEQQQKLQQEQQQKLKQQQQQEQQQKLQQHQQHGHYNTSSPMIYRSASKPPLANQHSLGSSANSAMGNSFRGIAVSSAGMNAAPQMKIGIGGSTRSINSSLTRHSSSPAGFFANLNTEGYGVISGTGNYGGASVSNDQINYSSGQQSSTSGLMRQNSDMEGKLMRMNSHEKTGFSNPTNKHNNNSNYGLPMNSWDDSIMSENFSGLDRGEEDIKPFSDQNSSANQNGESRSRLRLAHHLSLPKTSAEFAAMEKLLDLHDSVPLRIRAKRGCATHPRSIAERVRRTRISERMRKLQDLVPNMDKQTNTADMLDLAVDYIKDLQKHVKALNDNRAKCTCSR